jgi:apolipoprotein N-acyltransferase
MVALVLSALIVSAAFEPIGIWYAAIVGYALFLHALSKSRSPIASAFIFGLIVNAIVLHWSSKYVGALPWLLLSLLQALFYIPVGYAYKKTKSMRWVVFALLLCEELRARFPFGGFSWTRVAFSQSDSPFVSLVSYGGVLLLSTITLALAVLITHFRLKSLILAGVSIFVVGFLPGNPKPVDSLSLIAIQGNTPSVGLDFNSRAKAVFDLHRDLTRDVVQPGYDAIIWPENAIDIDPRNHPEVEEDIRSLVRDFDTPLVAGVVLNESGAPANASILYGADGNAKSTYIKQYLTPFGEYIPLRKIAEFLSPYAALVNDFAAGDKFVSHYIADEKVAPIICYEIINDGLVRQAAANSSALIVQTNSATFANTAQSSQQLAITRIRAIEHSREILSVSTVGISAFIDNNGAVQKQTDENISASIAGDLYLSDFRTVADRLGGVVPLLTLLASLLLAMLSSRRISFR